VGEEQIVLHDQADLALPHRNVHLGRGVDQDHTVEDHSTDVRPEQPRQG
jgi:hypothetical protein